MTIIFSYFFGQKILFPDCLGWIGSEKFFFLRNNTICFYFMGRGKNLSSKIIPFKKIKTKTEICCIKFFIKERFFFMNTLDGAIFFRHFSSLKSSRFFFSDFKILKIEKDPTQLSFFFVVSKKLKHFPCFETFFCLEILNLEEKKTYQLYKYKQQTPPFLFLQINQEKRLIVSSDQNEILFFFIDWDQRKIYLKKISYKSKILSHILLEKNLMVFNKKKNLVLFQFFKEDRLESNDPTCKFNKKPIIFIQKKSKILQSPFFFISHLENNICLIHLRNSYYVFHFDFKRTRKKKISFFPIKNQIVDIKKNPKTKNFVIITDWNEIYIIKWEKNFFFFTTGKIEIPLIIRKNHCLKNFWGGEIRINQLSFFKKDIFLIFGLFGFFHLIDIKKSDIMNSIPKFRKPTLSHKKEYEVCTSLNFPNKLVFISRKGFFYKLILPSNNKIFANFQDWKKKMIKTNEKGKSRKNPGSFSFQTNGRGAYLKISEFCLKIFAESYTSGFLKTKELFFRDKCSFFDFSEDGSLMVISYQKSLIIFRIIPSIKKLNIIPLKPFRIKGKLKKIRFLYSKRESLILISSQDQVIIWDVKRNRFNFRIKIKNFELEIDRSRKSIVLNTHYIWFPSSFNFPTIIVFNFNTCIPVSVFTSENFIDRCILSLNFYDHKKEGVRKIILLDNFLEIYKIKF